MGEEWNMKPVPVLGRCDAHPCVAKPFHLVLILALALAGSACSGGGTTTPPTSGGGTDTTAPIVTITSPTSNSSYTSPNASLALSGSASDTNGVSQVAWANNRGGNGTATLSGSETVRTWNTGSVSLQSGANVITVTATDKSNNSSNKALTVTYTTDTTPPSVVSVSPAANSTSISVNTQIQIAFSEALLSSSVTATTVSVSGVVGAVSLSGQTVTLTPTNPSPLAPSTAYTVTVLGGSNGVKDLAGNSLASSYSWTFTTAATVSGGYPCDDFYKSGFAFVIGLDNSPIPSIARPAKGVPTAEPTYKTCLVRISDAATEPPNTFARSDYSRRQAFNADNSKILVYAFDGKWHLYDARTMGYLKQVTGPGGDAEPQWHPTNPDILYYIPNKGGMTINKADISTNATTVVANFAGRLPWPTAARVSTKAEGSPSADARYWGFVVQDSNFGFLGLMTYDLQTDTILGTFTSVDEPNNVGMSPSGKYIVAQYSNNDRPVGSNLPGGPMAFTLDFSSYKHLRPDGNVAHTDNARAANGDDVFVGDDYNSGTLFMTNLETGVSTDLFSLWGVGSNYYAGHVSGKAFDKPGWVVASSYGGNGGWLHLKVYLVELKANPKILHLAHNHYAGGTGSNAYFAQPHASASRDLSRIIFNSNWDAPGHENVNAYMIEIQVSSIP
jgi:hypothetical protein